MMEIIQKLQGKKGLDVVDASTLLQFLQEQATPVLSTRNASPESKHGREHSSSTAAVRGPTSSRAGEQSSQVSAARRVHRISTLSETEEVWSLSKSKDARGLSFDLSSLEEFPPMGATGNMGGRKKGKMSSKPRRITLTPVDSQPHFSSRTAGGMWKSNPAFTGAFSSSDSPFSLAEERRLLQQERSKRRHRAAKSTEQRSWSHHSVAKPLSSSDGSTASPSSLKKEGSVQGNRTCLSAEVITQSLTSSPVKREEEPLQESPTTDKPIVMVPLTSTPLLTPQEPLQVSQRRVTSSNKKALDEVADIYARLINDCLVPNITSEIHFTIQLVTTPAHVDTANMKLVDGSTKLFKTADSCVYFAVAVLSRIKHIVASLDSATLRLLSENVRIARFHPELASFFAEVSERVSEECSSYCSNSQERRLIGVPFQEDTDNSKNFPNIKAFHAFKKQRDSFYSVLREWEQYHDTQNWSMETALGDRVRHLVRQPTELCSHAHFARLFQKQLVESCRYPLDTAAVEEGSSLAGHLSKMDPSRLMRLNKRFLNPSTGCGPCPPPSFSHTEEFFTKFITVTDSYMFNHHLMAAVYTEILKLHSSCSSIQPKDLPDLMHTMRVLAKFLGFLQFLPHKNPAPESLLSTREKMQPFNILGCVLEAGERGHLCATIPWVVEYLSMMDTQATAVEHHRTLLHTLVDVYRCVSFGARREGEEKAPNRGQFLIAATLGWLFEIPNTPTGIFFEQAKSSGDTSVTLSTNPECLDSQDVITTELLYACCPYLGELRSMLAEFAAGLQSKASPIRKIKPVSADIDHSETTPAKQLQLQLQEHFFRSHPPYLKQLCDISAERIAASAVNHCEANILPQHISHGVRSLSEWLKEKYASTRNSCVLVAEEPFNKVESERQVRIVTEDTVHSASEAARRFFTSHCRSRAMQSMEVLLAGTLPSQVVAVASDITAVWTNEKCSRWVADKLRAAVQTEVYRGFEKLRKTLNATLKSGAESLGARSLGAKSLGAKSLGAGSLGAGSLDPQSALLSISLQDNSTHEESALINDNRAQVAPKLTPTELGDRCHGQLSLHSHFGTTTSSPIPDSSVLEEFKIAAETTLQTPTQPPTAEQLARLRLATGSLVEHIGHMTSLLPGIHVPQLLPCGSEHTLSLSMDLASYLIAHGSLVLPQNTTDQSSRRGSVCEDLLEHLLRTWKIMKRLKVEIPVRKLMSATAFKIYIQQHCKEGVWRSLGDVLIGLVLCDITSSPVVESLWLCRKQQLPISEVHCMLKAAAIFLDSWYTYKLPEGSGLAKESSVRLREVHFVRLLSLVLQDLDQTDTPPSLLSRVHLKEIVHPF